MLQGGVGSKLGQSGIEVRFPPHNGQSACLIMRRVKNLVGFSLLCLSNKVCSVFPVLKKADKGGI